MLLSLPINVSLLPQLLPLPSSVVNPAYHTLCNPVSSWGPGIRVRGWVGVARILLWIGENPFATLLVAGAVST